MDEHRKARDIKGRFSSEYMTLGMLFGFLWGLMLLGSSWFLAIPAGMAIGALLDWRRTKARSR